MKCCACPSDADEFLNIDDLEAHISAEHFDCVPFECEKCRFSKFPTEFAIRRHFEEDHRMSEYYIRYKISRQLAEKLCAVRECLQRSCAASGVDFSYHLNKNFPILNNTVFNMPNGVHMRRTPNSHASNEAVDRHCYSNGGVSGEDANGAHRTGMLIKNESDRYTEYSPEGAAGANGGHLGDGPSAALAAFIRNASQAVNTAGNGDSNNNDKPSPKPNDDFNNFYSKLLTPPGQHASHDGSSHGEDGEEGTVSSEVGENMMDENQQAQQLLRHLESQLSTQNNPNSQIRRKRHRQIVKRFGGTPRQPKRRFGFLQGALDSSNHNHHYLANGENSDGCESNQFSFFQQASNILKNAHGGTMSSNFDRAGSGSSAGSPMAIGGHGGNALRNSFPSKVNEVQCQECKEMVTNRATSLNYHVNMKHLKYALFVCKGCNRNFLWQRTTIVTHVQRYHNGDESLIEDNSSIYMSEINLRRKVYFPVKCPASATATITNATPITSATGEERNKFCSSSHADMDVSGVEEVPSTSYKTSAMTTSMISNNDASGNDGDISCETIQFKNEETDVPLLQNHHHDHYLHQNIPATSSAQNGKKFDNLNDRSNLIMINGGGKSMGGVSDENESVGIIAPKKGKQLQCRMCNEMVVATKPWILLNHANSQHMHFPLFECGACHQLFTKYLRSYTVTHMKRYHDGREDLIIDNRSIYHTRLQEKCLEIFGVSL